MSFHFFSSNQVDILMHAMSVQLKSAPLENPFTPERILVPSQAMERWLNLKLSDALGISCNMEYPMPASWLWQQLAHNQGQRDALSRESSAWMIFQALPELLQQPAFAPLHSYLEHDHDGLKRWQLSDRIADTFDRYQYYRPELIRSWCAGEGQDWQAQLWRVLLDKVGNDAHRVAMMDAWQAALQRGDTSIIQALPERISMFCISSLPPLLLQLFQQLSEHIDIYFFHHSPTPAYWADLHSKKSAAQRRLNQPNEEMYQEELGHELLTSWGRQGQIFQDLLLNHASLNAIEYEAFPENFAPHQLGGIQRNIFETTPSPSNPAPEASSDDSISVHICHSPLRECQVLRDQLLRFFSEDTSLALEDVLVMVPDINTYAPYLHSVFAEQAHRPHLVYHLSDVALAEEHPVVHTFLQLLGLPDARFTRSEVESLLHVEEVCQHFGIDSIEDADTIHRLLNTLNVRWGLDAQHRTELDLPEQTSHTWQQARQRFLTGYAMSEHADVWDGIAPIALTGNEASLMAQFWQMVIQMETWHKKLAEERTAQEWQDDLTQMMGDFFGDIAEHDALLSIQEALEHLCDYADDSKIPRSLMQYLLQQKLGSSEVPNRYFAGGIQICGFRPMRSVPFRVICLLGMQDSDVPRREYPLSFDYMGKQWKPGDPSKAEQDRYLMLETLLAAQDKLYISYTGKSIRDNSDIQPSVLVQELLDEVTETYGKNVRNSMIHQHPLQAFSSRNFTEHAEQGFDAYWHKVAQSMQQRPTSEDNPSWPTTPLLDIAIPDEISLHDLIRFAKHPVKFFVNNTLGIFFHEHEELCDDEPFQLNHLEQWSIKQRYIQADLEREEISDAHIHAEGLLPHGAAGEVALEDNKIEAYKMIKSIQEEYEIEGFSPTPQLLDISIPCPNHSIRLVGRSEHYADNFGMLFVTPSALKGKYLLAAWLEHLALCAAGILQDGQQSLLICGDKKEVIVGNPFSHLSPEDANKALQPYIEAYIEGLRRPLPIFEQSSYQYIHDVRFPKPKTLPDAIEATAQRAAMRQWEGNSFNNIPGDQHDEYHALIMRHLDTIPVGSDAFTEWATIFYQHIPLHGASA